MSHDNEQWETENDEVARRLRAERPRPDAFELDQIKTTVMSRMRSSARRRPAPRSRLLVALLTVGLMVAGTAGTIAASNGPLSSGSGAAQSQYRPPHCNPHHHDCTCPSTSILSPGRDECRCPPGFSFAEGTNDCRPPCPSGSILSDSEKCIKCPSGSVASDANKCVTCPSGSVASDANKCVTCPSGSVASDSNKCVKCPSGSVASDSNKCVKCPPGTVASDSNKCVKVHRRRLHALRARKQSEFVLAARRR
jgi:hypothetical protein